MVSRVTLPVNNLISLIYIRVEPDLAGRLGDSCYPKSICGGDSFGRSTRLLAGPAEPVTLCPSRSGVHGYNFKGKWIHGLSRNPARTGREQRYLEPAMLEGCGVEANQGVPVRTSGSTEARPVPIFFLSLQGLL